MNIIIALLILGVIIAFHEFGHFIIAKARGITVREFSIGMGPKLFGFQKGNTQYCLRLLPIGGACVMGEDEQAGPEDVNAFTNKSVWERISVIFAGPFFNFVLAFLFALIVIGVVGYDPAYVLSINDTQAVAKETGLQVGDVIKEINGKKIRIGRELNSMLYFHEVDDSPISLVYERTDAEGNKTLFEESFTPIYSKNYMLGFYYSLDDPKAPAYMSGVIKDYPMARAGLLEGDIIVGIDDVSIPNVQALSDYLVVSPLSDRTLRVFYQRGEDIFETAITPLLDSEGYSLGFTCNYQYREKTNVWGVLKYSVYEVKYWIVSTVQSLGQIITGGVSREDIGGPVRIVDEIGNVVEESRSDGTLYVILNLLNWCILLSANLGVMNLLPIPALDGGRLMFLLIELVRGKPIAREKEGMVHLIGIILLLLLMVFVFYNDIVNVFFSK